ncbi:FAD-binding and (Fe-S)-binding domain-containing protein [Paenarthrobacter sp. YAF11_1]|uniref:FAD-binding and (Fe-S)-binding domain-containing protein n=1 Tax=Paenarthrobacter sp. YAF11_1 TaxID=3233074 RepID=UPI003F992878
MNPTSLPLPARLPVVDRQLLSALEEAVPGGLRSRATDRLALAHDASHYLLTPQAVVTPDGTADIANLLRAGASQGTHLTFRSGGTSLSGQSSTAGVLVDSRRNFREIDVLEDGLKVRVQPGATVRQVNARLAQYRRKLGPDPASEAACTIGGVVANNSSGMACGIEYNTYQTLESAVLVLPSGTVINSADKDADARLRHLEPELHAGLLRLRDRVRGNPDSLRTVAKLYAIKNTMGYGLNSFVDHDSAIDILTHLVIGSEGTLAFIAEATFRTIPALSRHSTALLVFNSLGAATGALPGLVGSGFATVELLDATSLRVAQRDPRAIEMLRTLPVDRHAALLVEHQADSAEELAHLAENSRTLLEGLPLAGPAALSQDPRDRADLWHIRKGLYATVAGNRPSGTTALLEDIAVPVPALLDTCEQLVELFDRHGYEDSVIFGHAKDGNIHFLLNERFNGAGGVDRYVAFTEDMVELVLSHDGTLKAEHGTGRIMAPFVRRQYGDELYAVMQEIKKLCDPAGLLNPGVLINEDPDSHISHLKVAPTVEKEVDRCVECGYCEPVCPSKDLTVTPRQRIALRREIADARAAGDTALLKELESEYQYDGIDTCAVDGMCQTACPVLIDTGDLVRRLRAEQRTGMEQRGWKTAANHWGAAAKIGGLALSAVKKLPAPLVTGAAHAARGILGHETVPLWEVDLPAGGTARAAQTAANPQAVYFPACIGTMFGPADGGAGVTAAFLALCERAGVDVAVPAGIESMCCGTPWKSKGLTDGLSVMRGRVLPALWEASGQGRLPIVCDAASCTEGLQKLTEAASADFPGLRILDAVTFVDEQVLVHLSATTPIGSLALHPTCSSTQLGTNDAMMRISAKFAGEVVVPDNWGCCAFAGDRGMLHPELTASATAREAKAIGTRSFEAYASTNRTCEIGLTRATGHQYNHLLELLEQATRPPTEGPVTPKGTL